MYDIAIIGAGPAGATLARLIGKQYRVLLLDRRPLDSPPMPGRAGKCCGGLISGNAQRSLAKMGLSVPTSICTSEQPDSVHVIDADNKIERMMQRPYINCHRELLDRWLISLLPTEVDVRCGCNLQVIEVADDGVMLTLSADGTKHTERARMLVGADGAFSMVRRRCFPHVASPRTYLAVQGWYEMDGPVQDHFAIFDRKVTDFYGWAVPKDGLLGIGAALAPRDDPHAHFARMLQSLAAYGITPGRRIRREGALINRPMRRGDIFTGEGRVVLLGEAAGWISPSSAEGFSYAFNSAIALAEALNEGVEGAIERYSALTLPLQRTILAEARRCAVLFTPWLRGLALRASRPRVDRESDSAQTILTAMGH